MRRFFARYNRLPHQRALLWAGAHWRATMPVVLAALAAEVWLSR